MNTFKQALLACVVLLIGIGCSTRQPPVPSVVQQVSAAQPDEFRCSPQKLYRGDTFAVEMPLPHGANLAVISPDDKFFFLAFEPSPGNSDYQPVIKESEFKTARRLELKTNEATGVLGVNDDGSVKKEQVFTTPGRYKVLLSAVGETLETEDPILQGSCEVEYSGERRSQQ